MVTVTRQYYPLPSPDETRGSRYQTLLGTHTATNDDNRNNMELDFNTSTSINLRMNKVFMQASKRRTAIMINGVNVGQWGSKVLMRTMNIK